MRLTFEAYLDAFSEELERTADALEALPGELPVPTCPGWSAGDLCEHLLGVYGRWRERLAASGTLPSNRAGASTGSDPASTGSKPATGSKQAPGVEAISGGQAVALVEEGAALLGELSAAGPEGPCWNWTGEDQTGGWLARRIALETAIHRVDAELASGRALPVEAELAADGIEERIEVFLSKQLPDAPGATLGGSLCLVSTDLDAAFVVEVSGGRLRWRRGRGPADAALVGTASELFLFGWNRLSIDSLSLTGRQDVAASWGSLLS